MDLDNLILSLESAIDQLETTQIDIENDDVKSACFRLDALTQFLLHIMQIAKKDKEEES